jgi:DNA invertase Pin-like site-specific DNA recombinase
MRERATPDDRDLFAYGIFASIAEFERELIRSGVRSGVAAARARGQRLDRPRVILDARRIAVLRTQGLGWKKIARQLGCGVSTVLRIAEEGSPLGAKMPSKSGLPSPTVSPSACAD